MKKLTIGVVLGLLVLFSTVAIAAESGLEYEITFDYNEENPYAGYVETGVEVSLDQGEADTQSQHLAFARQAALDTLKDRCLKILGQTKADFENMGYDKLADKISTAVGLSTIRISYTDKVLKLKGRMYFLEN